MKMFNGLKGSSGYIIEITKNTGRGGEGVGGRLKQLARIMLT